MKVDEDTQKALLLFNRRTEAAEADKAATRRLAKATKAKDEAADELKRVQKRGDSEAVKEADSNWRSAVDLWQRLRDGEEIFEETTPEPDQETTPEPDEETTPEPDQETTPEPDQETTPEPDEETTPEPDEETTPEPDEESSATPEKEE
ncbi:MAG: hypothetical protein P8M16_11215 [Acidimicrobiales bacterium]|nr:hypothetical protein [Acidimicrobiales bacterium]